MKANKRQGFTARFVLNAESLKRLDQIVRQAGAELAYSFRCTDGSNFKPDSLDDLLGFPNTGRRRIDAITFTTPFLSSPHIEVPADRTTTYGDSIAVTVEGEEKDVLYLSDQIEEWVASVRQRYSKFAFSTAGTAAP